MATNFTFTANTATGGVYDWTTGANWGAVGYPVGQTDVAIITVAGTYTVQLDTTSLSSIGLSTLELNNPNGTLALGSNSIALYDKTSLSGAAGDPTNTPLVLQAGTITDAGGTITARNSLQTGNAGTLSVDGVVTGYGVWGGNFAGTGSVIANGGKLELVNSVAPTTTITNTITNTITTTTTNIFEVAGGAGSILQLDSAVATGVNIGFASTGGGVLEIQNVGAFQGTIVGLGESTGNTPTGTNYIDVNAAVTSASISGNSIVLTGATGPLGTLALGAAPPVGAQVAWATDATLGGTDIFLSSTVCYAAGTHLLTDQGEVAVEAIAEGMRLMTLQGEARVPLPVTWVGRMRVDLARHPRPEAAAPIRIRRHAIAQNVPQRDLLVSPDHCLFLDGRLFVARSLVNGMSIVQDFSPPAITYYHIETERHAVALAENLPAETYLDTGNRAYFDNSGVALLLHPEFTVNAGLRCWQEDACAPLAITPEEREPVWRRLADRAIAQGYAAPQVDTTTDPDLRLVVAGQDLRPLPVRDGNYRFVLPRGAASVRLRSRAARPTAALPWIEDARTLGVSVARIVLRTATQVQDIPVDHPGLRQGWWAVEADSAGISRWTNGDATLPLPPVFGPCTLEVTLRHATTYALPDAPARKVA